MTNKYVIKSLARAGIRAQKANGLIDVAVVGDVVYPGRDHYGCAADDTRATGVEHIAVSKNESGEPFFTIPRADVMLEFAYQDRAAIDMVELEKRMDALAFNAVVLLDAFQAMQQDAFLHPLLAVENACAKHAPQMERRSMLTLLMVWRSICYTNKEPHQRGETDGESLGQHATNMMFNRFMRGE